MTGPDLATRQLVADRDMRRCVRCGGPGQQIHHRKPRGMGGTSDPAINSPANLVLLCLDCHAYIESHRAEACADGWLVGREADPEMVPVVSLFGHLTFHADGSVDRDPYAWLPSGFTPPF